MATERSKRVLYQGLAYLGTGGGLLAYQVYVLLIWAQPDAGLTPFEQFLTFPITLLGGVIISVLLGLGAYHILKAAQMSSD
ncbi:hypothetical protein EU545_04190 [Candidatus Thorarchaeota archaeon]|nr:MAG: hypothetical protein EU545_04190 [Candidatus Thorarchaeota archaeon]